MVFCFLGKCAAFDKCAHDRTVCAFYDRKKRTRERRRKNDITGDFLKKIPKAAIAFSGGVDSSYLLQEGMRFGKDVKAYYVKSQFQPEFELADAKRLATELGANMQIIEVDVLQQEAVIQNPPNRCYYCKQAIFGTILAAAAADGYPVILDGTNASDDANDRPGMQALAELRVLSPLRLCGLTKDEIRRKSREAGLFTWDKPAYACLATRIPSGMQISEDLLQRVEGAEGALFAMGFTDFRVRCAGGRRAAAVSSRADGRSTRTPRGDHGEAEAMVSGVIAGLGGTLMEQYELKEMLTHVADGSVSVEEAVRRAQTRAV